jgi:hypothetical protein
MSPAVSAEKVIAAPTKKVWGVISEPGNLHWCHPFCASNPVEIWPGPNSRDKIHYLSRWVYERRFKTWIEGEGYDLEIGRPGGVLKFPPIIRQLVFALRLRSPLQSYLDSVVRGFEWYVTRGEAVPRNAFGTHPWFSEG